MAEEERSILQGLPGFLGIETVQKAAGNLVCVGGSDVGIQQNLMGACCESASR